MSATITCETNGDRREVHLLRGQVARIGTSEWIEIPIDDPDLRAEHFLVDLRHQPIVSAICGAPLKVDGQPAMRAELKRSTSLEAGGSRFRIELVGPTSNAIEPSIGSADKSLLNSKASPSISDNKRWLNHEWFRSLGFDALEIAHLTQHPAAEMALDSLVSNNELALAIRLIAAVKPRSQCIAWTQHCLRVHARLNVDCDSAIEAWLRKPDEENRCVAAEHLPLDLQTEQDWLVQAVVWTGGSMSPYKEQPVPPPNYLTQLACSTALRIATANSDKPRELQLAFIEMASNTRELVS